MTLKKLFSPISLGSCEVMNRIVFTGHDTVLSNDGLVSDELVAYHEARAAGGCGLIITQVAGVHHTAYYTSAVLMADNDRFIPGYRRLVEACHGHGTKVFSQLFHPGREVSESLDGSPPLAFAPSALPNERFRIFPSEMTPEMIEEIVSGYGQAARRMAEAGSDGVEIVASHGYLPGQFLSSAVNRREDRYGGSDANRRRFTEEVIAAIRAEVGRELVVGIRISVEEMNDKGLTEEECLAAIEILKNDLDYVSVVAGSSATYRGATHIVPSMEFDNGYTAPMAARARARFGGPVIATGRINQPQIAEEIIASGQADLCGMTRAMICDPEMPNKARAAALDDIRACIGCNQACIGHFHKGAGISCIQYPETGRELRYGRKQAAARTRHVLVVGGGPAGMKAAAVAAERGHRVSLVERGPRLGGQALRAQLLPQRMEFGGIVTNLAREVERSGVEVQCGREVDVEMVGALSPDAVILACGARPYWPEIAGAEEARIVDAWQVLDGSAEIGHSVLIADWASDWISLGLAEKLLREGSRVRLAVTGPCPGEAIPLYIRDRWTSVLLGLGMEIVPYVRLYGADAQAVYLERTVVPEPVVIEGVDTLVITQGHVPNDELVRQLRGVAPEIHVIGDCLAPRNAEAAVLEGLKVGALV
jgi:2,4-dienoyl-CoA reductase-like NADH-dependent reductase (Old Yellow Enzyme family)